MAARREVRRMCGRYQFDTDIDIEEIKRILEEMDKAPAAGIKTGEIFPTDRAPVLLERDGRVRPEAMKWGFPRWDTKGVVINARSETVADKPMFKGSLAARRCLVPSTGFFEWAAVEPEPNLLGGRPDEYGGPAGAARKTKYRIRTKGEPLTWMAGLYNVFKDHGSGLWIPAFVIVTTAANEAMQPIHDRMPRLLTGGDRDLWLGDPADAFALLQTPVAAALEIVRNDG